MRPGPKPKDYSGQVINGVTVLKFSHEEKLRRYFECRCYCGKEFVVNIHHLNHGQTKSCGCLLKEYLATGDSRRSHGKRKTPEYNSWAGMIQRCTNPENHNYSSYGGRGISVCDRWINSSENFLADMGERPSKDHSLHRIDNDGPYDPSNCCWATKKEQARARRSSRYVEVNGIMMTLAEAAESRGMPLHTLWSRLANGWSIDKALSDPLRPWAPGKPLLSTKLGTLEGGPVIAN